MNTGAVLRETGAVLRENRSSATRYVKTGAVLSFHRAVLCKKTALLSLPRTTEHECYLFIGQCSVKNQHCYLYNRAVLPPKPISAPPETEQCSPKNPAVLTPKSSTAPLGSV